MERGRNWLRRITGRAERVTRSVGEVVAAVNRGRETKRAAVAAAQAEQARMFEAERLRRLADARARIQEVMHQGSTRPGNPNFASASETIADAAGGDLEIAITLVEALMGNTQEYNRAVLLIHRRASQQRARSEAARRELREKPIKVGGGFGGAIVALLMKDPSSMGDRLTIGGPDGNCLARSPSSRMAQFPFTYDELASRQVDLTPDWPDFGDKVLTWVGIVFQSDRVSAFFEKCMPYGMLYVFGRGRDKEYASIPTLFPALKLRKIREAVDGARRPPEDLPDLKNVPTEADLLRKVAEGAGITGDAVGGGPVG